MSNYTPPGFNGDDYEDEDQCAPLTDEQIMARDAEWPEFAEETERPGTPATGFQAAHIEPVKSNMAGAA